MYLPAAQPHLETEALQYIPVDAGEKQDEVPHLHANEFGAVPSVTEQDVSCAAKQMHCLASVQTVGALKKFALK